MQTVAIVGVGLIGGSFGLALREAGFGGAILGVSSERSIAAALRRGAIDRGSALEEAAATADLIFLSQPIHGILETLERLAPLAMRRGTVVTDAGSTKAQIEAAAGAHLRGVTFIGGHPMAGKEARGVEGAEAALFRERPWILTSDSSEPAAVEFCSWIEKFGARIVRMDAAAHDRTVAWASHLPQMVSTMLAALLSEQAPGAAQIAGPGLTDMTRLAMSSYGLWKDIIDTNREPIAAALDAFAARLREPGDIEASFTAGARFARQLRGLRE